jgi:hypothetical protein
MALIPTGSPSDIRKRLCDLVRILESHGIAWDYDLLIDLDLYIESVMQRKRVQ